MFVSPLEKIKEKEFFKFPLLVFDFSFSREREKKRKCVEDIDIFSFWLIKILH
jgi:hypothetical protein